MIVIEHCAPQSNDGFQDMLKRLRASLEVSGFNPDSPMTLRIDTGNDLDNPCEHHWQFEA